MKRTDKLLIISVLSAIASSGAFAAFDTIAVFGDAAGTTPPPSFTGNGTGTTTITGGGADFWGTSDIGGVFLYDNTGTYTTTGDFTATVRHVSTDNPAPEWGRDGILARATAGQAVVGTPQANDPNFMSFRKSNGQIRGGVRPSRGVDYAEFGGFNGPGVATNSYYFASARDGSTMRASSAMNVGTEAAPVAGRWVETGTRADAAFAAGTQLIVGLGHHAHGLPRVNTAVFDNWNYAGSFDATKFGPAAGAGATPWSVGGALSVNPANGAVSGRSFVQVGGVATGENTKWTVRAVDPTSLSPAFGAANAIKRDVAAEVADLVPASQFRRSAALTGLTADIYLAGNTGSLAGNRAIIDAASPPNGTAIIPTVDWRGGDFAGPPARYNGPTGPASFREAVLAVNPADTTSFTANQENYGVHMTGEIFITSDAARLGQNNNAVLFRDGIDDYTYLNIDGQVLLDDNDWQGYNAVGNGGSHVTAMNVSDPKFNDGEWVSFEMIMWEGGGGDDGALYTDMNDANGSFNNLVPLVATDVITMTGSNQVGNATTDGSFGFALPAGQWDVTLTVENTGTSLPFTQSLTVVPEPTTPLILGLTALGAILRRRRR